MKKANTFALTSFAFLTPFVIGAAALAAPSENYPTPGLYRVDTVGNYGPNVQKGSTEICVGKAQSVDPKTLPGCKGAPGVETPEGLKSVIKCAGTETTVITKKVDSKTWKYTTKFKQTGVPTAADNQMGMNALTTMLETAIKNSKDATERAELKKQLAGLKDSQGEMAKANRAREAALPADVKSMKVAGGPDIGGVTTYTRIADSCPDTKAKQ